MSTDETQLTPTANFKLTLEAYQGADARVIVPAGVVTIGERAFADRRDIEDVQLPDTVKHIGAHAFGHCSHLECIVIPDSVTRIDDFAFSTCTQAKSIVLGKGISELGNSVFIRCLGAQEVVLPDTLEVITIGMFGNCEALEEIKLPAGLLAIEGSAFQFCTGLKRADLPNDLVCIGEGAFSGCSSLQSVAIPGSVAELGKKAFHACTRLTDARINAATDIPEACFEDCSKLQTLELGEGVSGIGPRAFESCRKLSEVVIPASCTHIDARAFARCFELAHVVLKNPDTVIDATAFAEIGHAMNVTYSPDGTRPQRIMMMSGFLGAGKTTSMVALAQRLLDTGTSVALITNDLGENLVDTAYVKSFDIPVLEIPNTCCCQDVDTLNATIKAHIEKHAPEIVVFEPVGCCVDMVQLVYNNLVAAYPDTYDLAPISAIVDPARYQAIYMGVGENTFPEYIAYMFKKQLEEADLIIINKTDLLEPAWTEAICAHARTTFPGKTVLAISALEHTGIDAWMKLALTGKTALDRTDVDMDLVMDGCEKLGWYNKTCQVEGASEVDYGKFNEQFVNLVRTRFVEKNAEIAHLKIASSQGSTVCKTALTSCLNSPATSGALLCEGEAVLNVNIRALMDADNLNALMEDALTETLSAFGLTMQAELSQTFLSSDCAPAPVETYVPGTKGTRCCVPGYNDDSQGCCCC